MSALSFPHGQGGAVEHRQSTYWDLRFQEAGLWRVHFIGKKEFGFEEPGTFDSLNFFSSHPLLDDYLEPWESVYMSRPYSCSIDLVNRIFSTVAEESDGWRSADKYLNDKCDIRELMSGGYGLLFQAPQGIGRCMAQVFFEAGVRSSRLSCHGAKMKEAMVLVLGGSFVVAEGFNYESLSGAC